MSNRYLSQHNLELTVQNWIFEQYSTVSTYNILCAFLTHNTLYQSNKTVSNLINLRQLIWAWFDGCTTDGGHQNQKPMEYQKAAHPNTTTSPNITPSHAAVPAYLSGNLSDQTAPIRV